VHCGGDESETHDPGQDGGTGKDSGAPVEDAGVNDIGTTDAGGDAGGDTGPSEDAGHPDDAGHADDAGQADDTGHPQDSGFDSGSAADAAIADSGTDGGVLDGPRFSDGYSLCGEAKVDNAALIAACNATWTAQVPHQPPNMPRQCTALQATADVAMGCKVTTDRYGTWVWVEAWVRVKARSTGDWSFDPEGKLDYPDDPNTTCYAEMSFPNGAYINADLPCSWGTFAGRTQITKNADVVFARLFSLQAGAGGTTGQSIKTAVWIPFQETHWEGTNRSAQTAFALGIPVTGTVP
jgi:hypothetical protein